MMLVSATVAQAGYFGGGWDITSAVADTDKTITITIDSSLIDANITNFPMRLNISSSSGIVRADLCEYISEVV